MKIAQPHLVLHPNSDEAERFRVDAPTRNGERVRPNPGRTGRDPGAVLETC
jgi:hypothetical protein